MQRSFASKPSGEEENTSKDIGNPITWANPTGGASMDEKSPKYWRYVYPAGAALIMFSFYLAGRRHRKNDEKDKAEKKKKGVTNSYDIV
jgi:hypothetical protein